MTNNVLTTSGTGADLGHLAPRDQLVQFYADEPVLLDTLESFITSGLSGGESAIVIATGEHLAAVDARLKAAGVSLTIAKARDRYIPINAQDLLARFMSGGWPDEERFTRAMVALLDRASAGGSRVRVFGEMVALLWSKGQDAATLRLEQMWHDLCRAHDFSLFCAYPRDILKGDDETKLRELCESHARILGARAA